MGQRQILESRGLVEDSELGKRNQKKRVLREAKSEQKLKGCKIKTKQQQTPKKNDQLGF